jgi:hypothetical protein
MKRICFFLLLFGAFSVHAQTISQTNIPQKIDFQTNEQSGRSSRFDAGRKDPVGTGFIRFSGRDTIRILRPDNMPCLVPDITAVEPMPRKIMRNADRMAGKPARRYSPVLIVPAFK